MNFAIIASGPSLSEHQIELVKSNRANGAIDRIIVVNDNYRLIPGADYLYAADLAWWQIHYEKIKNSQFSGKMFAPWRKPMKEFLEKSGISDIELIRCENSPGFGRKDRIHCGGNSGYQALNLAHYLGAKTILLFGFDMRVDPETGKNHWFGKHPEGLRTTVQKDFDTWIGYFKRVALDVKLEGLRVINCSCPDSGLREIFEYLPVEEAVAKLQQDHMK